MPKKSKKNGLVTPRQKQRKGIPFLRHWRKHRGLNQQRLADRAEVTQGMISQLENGKSDYTGELIERLAAALNCTPADLMMRNPLDPESPWSIWDRIKPEARPQAVRMLKVLAGDEAA